LAHRQGSPDFTSVSIASIASIFEDTLNLLGGCVVVFCDCSPRQIN